MKRYVYFVSYAHIAALRAAAEASGAQQVALLSFHLLRVEG